MSEACDIFCTHRFSRVGGLPKPTCRPHVLLPAPGLLCAMHCSLYLPRSLVLCGSLCLSFEAVSLNHVQVFQTLRRCIYQKPVRFYVWVALSRIVLKTPCVFGLHKVPPFDLTFISEPVQLGGRLMPVVPARRRCAFSCFTTGIDHSLHFSLCQFVSLFS